MRVKNSYVQYEDNIQETLSGRTKSREKNMVWKAEKRSDLA